MWLGVEFRDDYGGATLVMVGLNDFEGLFQP